MLGIDPFRLAEIWEGLNSEVKAERSDVSIPRGRSQTWLVPGENPLDQNGRTFAAIEIASLDIIGKAVGRPVCDLLGGSARRSPCSAYLFYKHAGGGGTYPDAYGEALNPEALVRECRQMVSRYAFKEIKLKGGVLDPEIEMESMRALRHATARAICQHSISKP